MTRPILERLVSSYLSTGQKVYSFAWQGGEPTLPGVEFYRMAVELQQQHARPGSRISNALQTNGTLITDELAALLAEYRFLVGVSIDGPEDVHDTYRRYRSGEGSHADVVAAIDRLLERDVATNAIVLVSQANVRRAAEVYRYLVGLGINHHQYIPCVELTGGRLDSFAISAQEWGGFLVELFETWAEADVQRISIRHHDALVGFLVDGRRELCTMSGSCESYYVVERNGNVYPCDFFVEPGLLLGNVVNDDWGSIVRNPKGRAFASKKSHWNAVCGECRHLPYCSGDCTRLRADAPGDVGSWLCEGWKVFYDAALPVFERIADGIVARANPGARRWDPHEYEPEQTCYCGSGRKARNCHLARANQPTTLSATTSRSTSSAT